jgi:hypothetical protein
MRRVSCEPPFVGGCAWHVTQEQNALVAGQFDWDMVEPQNAAAIGTWPNGPDLLSAAKNVLALLVFANNACEANAMRWSVGWFTFCHRIFSFS